jgi:hypothetical protein
VATYSVLGLLGVAVGLSVADNASPDNLGLGAGVWAFLSLVIAMFFAGWVTTQCTVGETRTEAVLYGVIVWAVTATFLVWSAATGFGLGKAAMGDRSTNNQSASTLSSITGTQPANAASDANATNANSNGANNSNGDENRQRLQETAWWTFFGTVLSLLAAIGGAMLGPYEFVARRPTHVRTGVVGSDA